MNETLFRQDDKLAWLTPIVQPVLAEGESTIPTLNDRIGPVAAVACTEIKTDGLAVFNRTAGMCGSATDELIVYAAAPVTPGGIGASRLGGDEYAERTHESPFEPAIGYRFVPFDDCPPVVRALIARLASRLVGALLREFQVLSS